MEKGPQSRLRRPHDVRLGYSESPLIDGGKWICTPSGKKASMAALDKEDRRHRSGNAPVPKEAGGGYASAVVAEAGGPREYVSILGAVVGLVASTRRRQVPMAYKEAANGTANIPTPLVKGDLVFASTSYDRGAALLHMWFRAPKGESTPRRCTGSDFAKTLQNHHGGMVLVGDHVYGGHDHGQGPSVLPGT